MYSLWCASRLSFKVITSEILAKKNNFQIFSFFKLSWKHRILRSFCWYHIVDQINLQLSSRSMDFVSLTVLAIPTHFFELESPCTSFHTNRHIKPQEMAVSLTPNAHFTSALALGKAFQGNNWISSETRSQKWRRVTLVKLLLIRVGGVIEFVSGSQTSLVKRSRSPSSWTHNKNKSRRSRNRIFRAIFAL